MAEHANLTGTVSAGEIIKPWLILGPIYQDLSAHVQGLTLFERAGTTVGRDAMAETAKQAQEILVSTPREGDQLVGSPWAYARFGSGELSIRYGG